jgi:hypothetical protein
MRIRHETATRVTGSAGSRGGRVDGPAREAQTVLAVSRSSTFTVVPFGARFVNRP